MPAKAVAKRTQKPARVALVKRVVPSVGVGLLGERFQGVGGEELCCRRVGVACSEVLEAGFWVNTRTLRPPASPTPETPKSGGGLRGVRTAPKRPAAGFKPRRVF